jgi:hypothetical protein
VPAQSRAEVAPAQSRTELAPDSDGKTLPAYMQETAPVPHKQPSLNMLRAHTRVIPLFSRHEQAHGESVKIMQW